MRELILLVKTQIITRFRPDKSSSKSSGGRIAMYIGLGFAYIMLMGSIATALALLTPMVKELGFLTDLVLLIYIIGVMLVLMFGISSLITYVYMGRDNEFLNGLPVSQGKVFMSKLLVIYLYEFVTTLAIIAVPLLVVGIAASQGVVFYIILVLSTFFVPALPIVIASIIAIPFMYIVSFFRNKGAASTIAGMLVYVILFGGYLALVFSFQNIMGGVHDTTPEAMQELFARLQSFLDTIHMILYPLYALACVAVGADNLGLGVLNSSLVNIAIAAVSLLVLYVLAYFVSNLVYRRSSLAHTEAARGSGEAGQYKQGKSVIKTLMSRDFKEILRTTTFGFQYLLGIIMSPLMVVLMTVFPTGVTATVNGDPAEGAALLESMGTIMPFFMVLMLGAGMNMAAATAISREGKKFYIGKLLPVPPQTQIKAKLYLSLIIGYVSVGLSIIVMFFLGLRGYEAVFVPVILLLHTAGFAMFALRFDLASPKLNWTNPTDAVKHNRSANIPTFINMGVAFGALISGVVIYILSAMMTPFTMTLIRLAYWSVLTVLVVIEVLVTRHLLFRDAVKFYARLEV